MTATTPAPTAASPTITLALALIRDTAAPVLVVEPAVPDALVDVAEDPPEVLEALA